jgi:TonB family protein
MSPTLFLALTLAVTTTTPPTKQQVRIGNAPAAPGITLPKLVSYTRPLYTDEALQRRIEGVVTVLAEFDVAGNFKPLRVVKGLGFGLDESALAALTKWQFTPANRYGQRISVVTQIDIDFTLYDDPHWLRQFQSLERSTR